MKDYYLYFYFFAHLGFLKFSVGKTILIHITHSLCHVIRFLCTQNCQSMDEDPKGTNLYQCRHWHSFSCFIEWKRLMEKYVVLLFIDRDKKK